MYLNKALVFGNLTRDPELRSLPSGTHVATFSIATNRVWKNQEGQQQENTEFHNIVVFGRQGENVAQYLKKGSSALVEGRLQTRSWESDGVKKYRTEIVADRVQFGPRAGGGGQAPKEATEKNSNTETAEYPSEEINPDDIPF
jgi:single-strand DNA-binding protein|tara:strand:- start:29218 stop:29646 length:429 start_codon:yes stop_codon:yes gene_type:complete